MTVSIGLAILVVGWCAGWWLLWRVPRLPAAAGAGTTSVRDDVVVVVPARDEAASLPALLESLRGQRTRPGRVVVVDDASRDATAELAAAGGAEVVTSAPLPPGWTGKCWACHQGAALAGGSTLVFLDADVTLAPDALGALLAAHERQGGLLSVQPHHRVLRPYERLSAVFNLVGVMGVGMASPWRRRTTAAFGPCLVTSRADYRSVGGHAAVRSEIIEDVALGQAYARAGLPVRAYGGGRQVSFRMYPEGFAQLVEGWSKNFASGAGAIAPWRLPLVALWITAVLSSVRYAFDAAVGPTAEAGIGLMVYLLVVLQLWVMLRQVGTFGITTAVAYPLAFAGFVLVFARSAWLSVVRREVRWRGRPIPLAADRRRAPPQRPQEPAGARRRSRP